ELVDTGGMGLHDSEELADHIQMQILIAIEQADLVLLVVDVKDGVQPLDGEIAQQLREAGKQVLLVASKCDGPADETAASDFYALGLPEIHMTSAAHRRGIGELVRKVADALPEAAAREDEATPAEEPMKLAIVGRRNVGKSTLINYLADEPRVLVSEVPGTTRDSVDVRFRIENMEFIAIDTAGLRRRKQIKDSIDFYSTARSKAAIRRANVVVHMMEAPMEAGRLDKQLAAQVLAEYKPCVLAVNKMDLAEGVSEEQFSAYIRDRLPGVSFAPLVCISAVTGQGVMQLLDVAQALHEQSLIRVPTGELNRAVEQATTRRRPPSTPSRSGRIYYATQVAVEPPTIALFVNEPGFITRNYQRYLANQLRKAFGYSAIPIRFLLRSRTRPEKPTEDGDHGG
ncbi:MAG: ribosome biogenesis GTPase Der, partial [Planctomycetota bacterium]